MKIVLSLDSDLINKIAINYIKQHINENIMIHPFTPFYKFKVYLTNNFQKSLTNEQKVILNFLLKKFIPSVKIYIEKITLSLNTVKEYYLTNFLRIFNTFGKNITIFDTGLILTLNEIIEKMKQNITQITIIHINEKTYKRKYLKHKITYLINPFEKWYMFIKKVNEILKVSKEETIYKYYIKKLNEILGEDINFLENEIVFEKGKIKIIHLKKFKTILNEI